MLTLEMLRTDETDELPAVVWPGGYPLQYYATYDSGSIDVYCVSARGRKTRTLLSRAPM